MSFAAQPLPTERDEGRGGSPPAVPANSSEWLELCRKQFIRQWHEQHPDDFEDSPLVYGD